MVNSEGESVRVTEHSPVKLTREQEEYMAVIRALNGEEYARKVLADLGARANELLHDRIGTDGPMRAAKSVKVAPKGTNA